MANVGDGNRINIVTFHLSTKKTRTVIIEKGAALSSGIYDGSN
jgi:hypothetical protein